MGGYKRADSMPELLPAIRSFLKAVHGITDDTTVRSCKVLTMRAPDGQLKIVDITLPTDKGEVALRESGEDALKKVKSMIDSMLDSDGITDDVERRRIKEAILNTQMEVEQHADGKVKLSEYRFPWSRTRQRLPEDF